MSYVQDPHPARDYRRRLRVACALVIAMAFSFAGGGQAAVGQSKATEPVFRAPFTLKLRVDDKRYYSQDFDKVPYVLDGDVYLFLNESFGVKLTTDGERVTGVTYEPDVAKTDVTFSFSEEKSGKGVMMLLTTRNKTRHKLFMDALMTVPEQTGVLKTNVLPIAPGLSNFESWPHPIVQLVLRNLRFTEDVTTAK